MSDVFISYAREDRALAEALADHLKRQGFGVWWDAELVGSDDFYEVILQALDQAKAAIVIWSEASAVSRFVRDEARFALYKNKLVATKTPELDIFKIPFGFQGQHTVSVTDRDEILRAVEKLGLRPKERAASIPSEQSADLRAWDRLKGTTDVQGLLSFLDEFPTSAHRQDALDMLRKLFDKREAAAGSGSPSLRTNVLSSFFSGLTLRVPKFQLHGAGIAASIGASISLVIFSSATAGLIVYYINFAGPQVAIGGSMILLFIALLGWVQFKRWLQQKNVVAALIPVPFSILISMLGVAVIAAVVSELYLGAAKKVFENFYSISASSACAVLSIIYAARQIRRAQ